MTARVGFTLAPLALSVAADVGVHVTPTRLTLRNFGARPQLCAFKDLECGAQALVTLGPGARLEFQYPRVALETIALESDGSDEAPATDAFAALAGRPRQALAEALAEIRSILAGPTIQARCIECSASVPARIDARDLSLLDLLKTLAAI